MKFLTVTDYGGAILVDFAEFTKLVVTGQKSEERPCFALWQHKEGNHGRRIDRRAAPDEWYRLAADSGSRVPQNLDQPLLFPEWLTQSVRETPELFPEIISEGFQVNYRRRSSKVDVWLRQIRLRDGTSWNMRPSFVMPGMVTMTDEMKHPLLLRNFGLPFRALAWVFGRNHMFWYRAEIVAGPIQSGGVHRSESRYSAGSSGR